VYPSLQRQRDGINAINNTPIDGVVAWVCKTGIPHLHRQPQLHVLRNYHHVVEPSPLLCRQRAYMHLATLQYGKLAYQNRFDLPQCVVKGVRKNWPAPDRVYCTSGYLHFVVPLSLDAKSYLHFCGVCQINIVPEFFMLYGGHRHGYREHHKNQRESWPEIRGNLNGLFRMVWHSRRCAGDS
jgi:hypothetical protein